VPLTAFQAELSRFLAVNRAPDSYLAGGAAIHFLPTSIRYSNDLDYFHDSVARVANCFTADQSKLVAAGYVVRIEIQQPGHIRAIISRESEATKVDWAHDSSWRFMPIIADKDLGYRLHPIDLATNKVLALAGRSEARDFLDVMHLHSTELSLGALIWAATGKDPGFSPGSLLELIRRRGKYQAEDFSKLHLRQPIDIRQLKVEWLAAIETAEIFISERTASETGCLYFDTEQQTFVSPQGPHLSSTVVTHFGRPGGVLPSLVQTTQRS